VLVISVYFVNFKKEKEKVDFVCCPKTLGSKKEIFHAAQNFQAALALADRPWICPQDLGLAKRRL